MEQISRKSKLPLYQQLYDILRGGIQEGEWKPGEIFPPESELIDTYQVSRVTVRQVLDMLVRDGLIDRQRGRGSFVLHPTVEQVLTHIISFTDDMRRRGFQPGTRVLDRQIVPAPKKIAEKLSIHEGDELARIRRIRLADGDPMSVEESHLVYKYCPGILEYDFAENPLREILEEKFDIKWSYAEQSIRAIEADEDLANALDIPEGSAILFLERISYTQDDTPVEFLRIFNRGDRYSLHARLVG